ncbi:MAG: carbohydrate porin [Proteobacteria bacterium]|nr:carbohydrate porin [Pseudomonadota bacterium]
MPRLGLADDAVDYQGDTLTGSWRGARTTLAEHGVDTEITYTIDVIGNPSSGGIRRGVRALDNLNVIFSLDGEKLVGAHGTSAKVFLHNNDWGTPDQDLVGSAQGVDNIEVGDENSPLYEAWLQQEILDGKVSVRAGLYDLNSEFYATSASGLFLHPSYGIGADLSQTGPKGPSIFPLTSLSAHQQGHRAAQHAECRDRPVNGPTHHDSLDFRSPRIGT